MMTRRADHNPLLGAKAERFGLPLLPSTSSFEADGPVWLVVTLHLKSALRDQWNVGECLVIWR